MDMQELLRRRARVKAEEKAAKRAANRITAEGYTPGQLMTANLSAPSEASETSAAIGTSEASQSAPLTRTEQLLATLDLPSNLAMLNDQQLAAVETAERSNYSNLIGYAGTGKTFTTLEIVNNLIRKHTIRPYSECPQMEHLTRLSRATGFNFALCAFTGKAVENIQQNVPEAFAGNCYTIHKLIDYAPVLTLKPATPEDVKKGRAFSVGQEIEKLIFMPRRDAANPLTLDFVLVDEISMVGTGLLRLLLDALPPTCRIVAVGDLAQLTPVMDKSAQPMLLQTWPVTELTKVYRQESGGLIANAHAIRAKKMPTSSNEFKLFGLDADNDINASAQLLAGLKARIQAGTYDPLQDALLTPMNNNPLGQEMLNISTRRLINPTAKTTHVKTMRNAMSFAVGDRILNETNDGELGIFNGMLGTVLSISRNVKAGRGQASANTGEAFDFTAMVTQLEEAQAANKEAAKRSAELGYTELPPDDTPKDEEGTGKRLASHTILVLFDNFLNNFVAKHGRQPDEKETLSLAVSLGTSSQLEKVKLGWWITVHKSQGSGFRHVTVALHNTMANMLSNELLYTAVTRAKETVSIYASKYAFNKSLRQARIKGDTLEEKIASYCEAYPADDTIWDIIPKNIEENAHASE